MEKLNIAEILKDCPEGTKLYSLVHGEVELTRVGVEDIYCKPDYLNHELSFNSDGGWVENKGECILFPSKENRDWSTFQRPFKDGDVVVCKEEGVTLQIFILKSYLNNNKGYCYIGYDLKNNKFFEAGSWYIDRLATEEEKQKLFDAIKANGYKWNPETKTLEKLIESKEDTDDRIVISGLYFDRENYADEVELHLNDYEIEIRNGKTYAVFKNQETKALKPKFKVGDRIKHRLTGDVYKISSVLSDGCGGGVYNVNVTNELGKSIDIEYQDSYELAPVVPKFKVGDRVKNKASKNIYTITDIRKDEYIVKQDDDRINYHLAFCNEIDWELVPNKFDITTLNEFESRVLVRDYNIHIWEPAFFGKLLDEKNPNLRYLTTNGCFKYCIPYENNQHLLGTTDDCDEYYKTWE